MISAIILSKDRAMQLDLLLASINKHCPNVFDDVSILYNASSDDFEAGYQKISANLIKETGFEPAFRQLAKSITDEMVCILSDDCIFYRDSVDKSEIVAAVNNPDTAAFTFGVGCDSRQSFGRKFKLPPFHVEGNIMYWNWKNVKMGEFACPFTFAGNFYKTEDYLNYLDGIEFSNPSTLEYNLQQTWQSQRQSEMKNLCSSMRIQGLVHSLNNRVQNDFQNINGQVFPFSPEELNTAFLNGDVIDLDALDFTHVDGLHKEINLVFKKA